MPKGPTLEDLNDGRFNTEPMKNKRHNNPDFDSSKKSSKDNPKFLTVPTVNWTVQSRYLLIHLFYNVLAEKARSRGDKLPSIDESTINTFKSPEALKIGQMLVNYRKDAKILTSLQNAMTHVRDDSQFIGDPSPTGKKAIVTFQPHGYDNVERIFTRSGESIPINADKRVRYAFVTTEPTLAAEEVSKENLQYIPDEEINDGTSNQG